MWVRIVMKGEMIISTEAEVTPGQTFAVGNDWPTIEIMKF
jgi:hypothetical protein